MSNLAQTLHRLSGALLIAAVPLTLCPLSATGGKGKADAVNGIPVGQLESVISMLKDDPKSGQVTFYSHSRWQDGMRAGVLELRANIAIAGDADPEILREIASLGVAYSPVSESLRNGIEVTTKVNASSSGKR